MLIGNTKLTFRRFWFLGLSSLSSRGQGDFWLLTPLCLGQGSGFWWTGAGSLGRSRHWSRRCSEVEWFVLCEWRKSVILIWRRSFAQTETQVRRLFDHYGIACWHLKSDDLLEVQGHVTWPCTCWWFLVMVEYLLLMICLFLGRPVGWSVGWLVR